MSRSSSSGSSREGSVTPIQRVAADVEDVQALRHRRRELGKVWTAVQRLEGLIADGNDEIGGLEDNLSVAESKLARVKARLERDPLVQLYDRANPGRKLRHLAFHDAFMIDFTIQNYQSTNLDERCHWINFVNQYMENTLPAWGTQERPIYIALEDPNARNVRRSAQRRSDCFRRAAVRQSESRLEPPIDPRIVAAERRRAQIMERDRQENQERQMEILRQYEQVMSTFDARWKHSLLEGRMPLPTPPNLTPTNTTGWRGLSGNPTWLEDHITPLKPPRVEALKGEEERGRKMSRESSPSGGRSRNKGSRSRQPRSDPNNPDIDL